MPASETPSLALPVGIAPDPCSCELGSWGRAGPPTHILPRPPAGRDQVSPNPLCPTGLCLCSGPGDQAHGPGECCRPMPRVDGAKLTGAPRAHSSISCPSPVPGMKAPHYGWATSSQKQPAQPGLPALAAATRASPALLGRLSGPQPPSQPSCTTVNPPECLPPLPALRSSSALLWPDFGLGPPLPSTA